MQPCYLSGGGGTQMKMPVEEHNDKGSNSPWKEIVNLAKKNELYREICKEGLRKCAENGKETRLWKDVWVGNVSLQDKFPRLFAVSNQKNSTIYECGVWIGSS
ncbi:hypothetical protein AHAS_Ahas16G0073800 [Arachis hypogaea]